MAFVTPLSRRTSVHLAVLDLALAGQAEARLRPGERARDERGRVTADRRAVLEPVAGSGPDEDRVLPLRMPVDEQVAVRAVLVLAHARFGERARRERREAACEVGPGVGEAGLRRPPVARIR